MIDLAVLQTTLKRPRVLLSIVAAVLIVIIWTFAFFLPQGSTISSLKVQEASLQAKIQAGDATVARLRHTYQHSAEIKTMQAKLNSAVPAKTDAYNYVQALSKVAAAAGVHLTSLSISSGSSSSTSASSKGTSSSATLNQLPVNMSVKGTYDQILSLLSKIYLLPRLTDINELTISGGGATSNRSTVLSANLMLVAFFIGVAQTSS